MTTNELKRGASELGSLLIEVGPFAEGETLGGFGMAFVRGADLNGLRDELIALRAERGAPDILIDKLGDVWLRIESGRYAIVYAGEPVGEAVSRSTVEIAHGPVIEAWR